MKYILYNPKANNGQKPECLDSAEYKEVIGLDYQKFIDELKPEDEVVLVGGDGTLNYFVNEVDTDSIRNNVYLMTAGTGNDFMNDLNNTDGGEILVNEYIRNLPTVYVNGIEKKFINGIGYGIDGYCCEVADQIREKDPGKQIDYTGIAIKGLLFHFKKKTATIKVDGKEYNFKNVWLAPSMKGRFYGGGMMVAPDQNRLDEDLTCVIYHTASKLKALIAFPDIFKGTHVRRKGMVSILKGKEIEVSFTEPCALQIDGDTVLNVSSYKVKA
ncbi:MAG: diacylglycerol kinase family protein [Clostridiales bacterium]|nr:diacylglycerol kinase family protein [Candidatus Crickella caballi]